MDTCQYRTILVADVPRVSCSEHGVLQIRVPWAEARSRFTAVFEALVIDWLQAATIQAVSRRMGLTWDEVDGVMQRAVKRGMARREQVLPRRVGVDETSFRRRFRYVTVVSEGDRVLYVAEGRKQYALEAYWDSLPGRALDELESITMDMWGPYIFATEAKVPDAEHKIVFDKYHVALHLGRAVDAVRRQENRQLAKKGDWRLKGTKFMWLRNPANMTEKQCIDFAAIWDRSLKTSRAWAIKEAAMDLWSIRDPELALEGWKRWYGWAIRSRLEPIKKAARMVKKHLLGVVNATVLGITNARAEGINSIIQWIKKSARGFRNRERFKNAIYFHLGGLDLYPAGIRN